MLKCGRCPCVLCLPGAASWGLPRQETVTGGSGPRQGSGEFLSDSEGIQQIFAEQQIFVVPGPAMDAGARR